MSRFDCNVILTCIASYLLLRMLFAPLGHDMGSILKVKNLLLEEQILSLKG